MDALEVDRIAENDRNGDGIHQVQVTMGEVQYRQLVGDLLSRLRSLGHLPPLDDPTPTGRQDALTYWMPLVPPRPSWLLEPEAALALSTALAAACEEPPSCACGRFIEEPSSLTELTGCASCSDQADQRGRGSMSP